MPTSPRASLKGCVVIVNEGLPESPTAVLAMTGQTTTYRALMMNIMVWIPLKLYVPIYFCFRHSNPTYACTLPHILSVLSPSLLFHSANCILYISNIEYLLCCSNAINNLSLFLHYHNYYCYPFLILLPYLLYLW